LLSDTGNIATLLTQLAITKIISKSILNINKNKMNNLNNDTFNVEHDGTYNRWASRKEVNHV